MISDEEIRKIKKLINQGKSDYKIGMELGHSPNTVKKFREKYKISEVSHNNIWNMLFKNPIDDVLELIKNIKNIVNTAELKAEVRCELEKLLEKLQEIVRLEVDDRISKVKTDAIEKRDKEWSKVIDQSYVKKDVVTDLNNAIKEMDNKIATHNYKIDQKDQVIASIRQENKCLKNQIRNLLWQKIGLEENIGNLNDFIDNYLDKAGQREREKLRHEEKDLMIKKTDFDRHMDIQQTNLDKIYLEINKKQGAVEKREKKMAKQDENIKKQKQELKTTWKKMLEIKKNLEKWQEQINNQIENIKKNWKNVLKTAKELRTEEKRLQKWQKKLEKTEGFNNLSLPYIHCRKPMLFEATDPEKNKKPKCVSLIPVSYIGKTVVRSGFSPVIRSGGEPMIVTSGLEPVIQTGFPLANQSGEELKAFGSNGYPISRSGV